MIDIARNASDHLLCLAISGNEYQDLSLGSQQHETLLHFFLGTAGQWTHAPATRLKDAGVMEAFA